MTKDGVITESITESILITLTGTAVWECDFVGLFGIGWVFGR